MDIHVKDFYQQSSEGSPKGNFHKVLTLHDGPEQEWKELHQLVPDLPRGWFELGQLKSEDRIDFTRDFWLAKLGFQPKLSDFLMNFFAHLDDIGIFITQKKFDDPYEAHLIYSLKNNGGYFCGCPPATEQDLLDLKNAFPNFNFPEGYLLFLQIHDGFSKTTDTGIIRSQGLLSSYRDFQKMLSQQEPITTGCNDPVDPKSLIPFYESFGMPFFQCFWAEWYPENEMGSVYYSGQTRTISNVKCKDPMAENLAFPSFTDWLMFYLETFE